MTPPLTPAMRKQLKATFGREKPRKYPWCQYTQCPWYAVQGELRELQRKVDQFEIDAGRRALEEDNGRA